MQIPDVWMRMGRFVHQDFMLIYPDFFSGIVSFLSAETPEQRRELFEYCSFLVSQTPAEILAAWDSTPSDLAITSDGAVKLVQALRQHLSSD